MSICHLGLYCLQGPWEPQSVNETYNVNVIPSESQQVILRISTNDFSDGETEDPGQPIRIIKEEQIWRTDIHNDKMYYKPAVIKKWGIGERIDKRIHRMEERAPK